MGADNTFGEVNLNPGVVNLADQADAIIMQPTNHLRYMLRDVEGTDNVRKVLVQAWQCVETGKIEWREIEEVYDYELET